MTGCSSFYCKERHGGGNPSSRSFIIYSQLDPHRCACLSVNCSTSDLCHVESETYVTRGRRRIRLLSRLNEAQSFVTVSYVFLVITWQFTTLSCCRASINNTLMTQKSGLNKLNGGKECAKTTGSSYSRIMTKYMSPY